MASLLAVGLAVFWVTWLLFAAFTLAPLDLVEPSRLLHISEFSSKAESSGEVSRASLRDWAELEEADLEVMGWTHSAWLQVGDGAARAVQVRGATRGLVGLLEGRDIVAEGLLLSRKLARELGMDGQDCRGEVRLDGRPQVVDGCFSEAVEFVVDADVLRPSGVLASGRIGEREAGDRYYVGIARLREGLSAEEYAAKVKEASQGLSFSRPATHGDWFPRVRRLDGVVFRRESSVAAVVGGGALLLALLVGFSLRSAVAAEGRSKRSARLVAAVCGATGGDLFRASVRAWGRSLLLGEGIAVLATFSILTLLLRTPLLEGVAPLVRSTLPLPVFWLVALVGGLLLVSPLVGVARRGAKEGELYGSKNPIHFGKPKSSTSTLRLQLAVTVMVAGLVAALGFSLGEGLKGISAETIIAEVGQMNRVGGTPSNPDKFSALARAVEKDPRIDKVSVLSFAPWKPAPERAKRLTGEWIPVTTQGTSPSLFSQTGQAILKGSVARLGASLEEGGLAVLGQGAAKALFGELEPVGQSIQLNLSQEPHRVVGVVEDFWTPPLLEPPLPTIYFSGSDRGRSNGSFLLVDPGEGEEIDEEGLARIISHQNPGLQLLSFQSLKDAFVDASSGGRFALMASLPFLLGALILMVIATLSVTRLTMEEMRRELWLRMALGSTRREGSQFLIKRLGGVALEGILGGGVFLFAMSWFFRGSQYFVRVGSGAILLAVGLALLVAMASIVVEVVREERRSGWELDRQEFRKLHSGTG